MKDCWKMFWKNCLVYVTSNPRIRKEKPRNPMKNHDDVNPAKIGTA
jgi:hypothetical protein